VYLRINFNSRWVVTCKGKMSTAQRKSWSTCVVEPLERTGTEPGCRVPRNRCARDPETVQLHRQRLVDEESRVRTAGRPWRRRASPRLLRRGARLCDGGRVPRHGRPRRRARHRGRGRSCRAAPRRPRRQSRRACTRRRLVDGTLDASADGRLGSPEETDCGAERAQRPGIPDENARHCRCGRIRRQGGATCCRRGGPVRLAAATARAPN
jgi:hypothetical protein